MRSFLIKSNNYRPGNLGIYNYQVNIDENSGSVTLLTNVGEYILGGNGDIKLTNYYTKEEMDNIIQDLESGEIDLTRYYTKEQIDDLLDNIETGNVDLTNYFTKTEVEEYVNTQTVDYVDMETLDIITDSKISNATLDLVEKEPFNNLTSKVNTLEDRVNNIDTGDIDLSEYAKMEDIEGFITEAEVDSKVDNIVVDLTPIEESLGNKVDKVEGKDLSSNDFTDSYKESLDGLPTALSEKISSDDFNTYMSQLESDLDGRINNLSSVQITTMDVLPEAGETNIIYLIPKGGENPTNNIKDEYIWILEGESGRFELIGTTEIDLSNYYNRTQVDGALSGKVDIEAGKGLSTNDFVSTNYLTKTEIETGLETKVDKDGDKVLSTNDFIASDYYNRGEVDDLISNVEVDLTDYATKTYVQTEIENIEFPTVDLEPYATKVEIDTKLEGYPTTSDVEGMIDEITAGDIDLAGYYNKEDVDTKLLLKVDNVEGKDLSSNDFTDSYKESLDGLSDALDSKADENETNLEIERLENKIDSNTTILAQKANQDTTYTKTEVDSFIPKLDGYATEDYVTNAIDGIDIPSIVGLVTEDNLNAALSGKIDNTYKAEVTTEIDNAILGLNIDDYATEDYVTNAIDGINIPSIDGLVTEDDLNTALSGKIDNTYKAEVTTEIDNAIVGLSIDTYAKKDLLDAKLDTTVFEAYETNIATSLSDLDGRINNLSNVQIATVDVLPETGETNIIYLIPKVGENPTNNIKDEYIWISEGDSGRFELIGTTEIDLSNYYTKDETLTRVETSALIDSVIAGEIDLTNYYTKTETGNEITIAITDLDLDNRFLDKAPVVHEHEISDITNLSDTLSNKVDNSELDLYTTTDNLNKNLVGLSNVDNTSDIDKPLSTATIDALLEKADKSELNALATKDELSNKVDKVEGKGLSTDDFVSTDYLTKTEIETGLGTKSPIVHTHDIDNITGLQDVLNSKLGPDSLVDYSTTEDTNDIITSAISNVEGDFVSTINDINNELDKKVDKVDGMGLSTNDYTTVEKNKLENLDNTKDIDKPISTATQTELDLKANKDDVTTEIGLAITGLSISQYETTENVDSKLDNKANSEHTHTISEIDGLEATLESKLESNDLAGYPTTTQMNSAISSAIGGMTNVTLELADELPETGDTNIIYLVPNSGLGDNIKDEYIWILEDESGRFELIGTTEVDLSNHYTKTEVDGALSGKVNKDGDKVLSTNDYTTAEKDKLGNLDNTKDADKPISTATQAALELKADKSVVAADISSSITALNISQYETTASVSTKLSNKVDKVDNKGLSTNDFIASDYFRKNEVETELQSKAEVEHTHDVVDIIGLTKASVALSNVDNTSDANKPISTATQAALDSKADSEHTHTIGNITNLQDTLNSKANVVHTHVVGEITGLTKASVELSNVDNTSDLSKPVSTATQTALASKANSVHTHTISDIDDLEDTLNSKAGVTHTHPAEDITGLTKTSVGLPNVDNTSDLSKPISTATQNALNLKADSGHTHTIGNITNLQDALDSKASQATTYTKDEVDDLFDANSGGTTYQMISTGGTHTFGGAYENYIILTNSTTDITITIPEGNTNYIVRNINPQGRVFFTAGTGATIHASSTGLVNSDYVIVGYGLMSVIVHGTDIILTGGM